MEEIKRGRGRPAGTKKVSLQARPDDIIDTPVVEEVPEAAKVSKVNRSGRPKRTPINGYRDVLRIDGQEPGWHYAWITDKNTYRFEQAGYEFVTHECVVGDRRVNAASQIGSKISIPGGNGVTQYAMRVPQDIYDEEMELLAKQIDESEQEMKQNLNSRDDGRYGSVKIKRGKIE